MKNAFFVCTTKNRSVKLLNQKKIDWKWWNALRCACVNVWHWILKFIFCPFMHKSMQKKKKKTESPAYFSLFGQIPCRRQNACTLQSSKGLRGEMQERCNANKRQRNKSFQNSDQIQICRRLLFIIIITIPVASFREIDFALFFFFFFSSARFRSEHFGSECNFISKIKRTRLIVWLLADGFSWIILLWIYWCVAFEFLVLRCDSLSPHAFDYF